MLLGPKIGGSALPPDKTTLLGPKITCAWAGTTHALRAVALLMSAKVSLPIIVFLREGGGGGVGSIQNPRDASLSFLGRPPDSKTHHAMPLIFGDTFRQSIDWNAAHSPGY